MDEFEAYVCRLICTVPYEGGKPPQDFNVLIGPPGHVATTLGEATRRQESVMQALGEVAQRFKPPRGWAPFSYGTSVEQVLIDNAGKVTFKKV